MKTSTKRLDAARSRLRAATNAGRRRPSQPRFARDGVLRLRAYAWLKKPPRSSSRARSSARHLDVARREEEDLVGDPLHAAVERVGEAAREVDQPLRELLVGALEVEDHRDAVLEPVGDLLRVVEAARQDEVDAATRRRLARRLEVAQSRAAGARARAEDARPLRPARLGVGPVVVVLAAAAPRREPADVRPLGVVALELLVGEVAVLVPVLLLGDAEVDERAVPDVAKAPSAPTMLAAATGLSRPGRRSRPPRRRRGSPGSCPSRARAGRAPRRARAGGGSTAATPPGRPLAGGIVIRPRTSG